MSPAQNPVHASREDLAKRYAAQRQSQPKMPEIKLSSRMSKSGVPFGHFFTVDRNVGEGEDPIITDIGKEFPCIVLRNAMRLQYYDKKQEKTVAETTEFNSFTTDPIFVFDNTGEQPQLATVLPYSGPSESIKKLKIEPTREDIKAGRVHPLYAVCKDLRLQYITYVLYKPEGAKEFGIYQFKVGARGWLGADKDGAACRYGEEADDSFIKAKAICGKKYRGTTHMHIWNVGVHTFKMADLPDFGTDEEKKEDLGDKDCRPTFTIDGEWPDDMMQTVDDAMASLKDFLSMRYASKIGYAFKNTEDKSYIPAPVLSLLESGNNGAVEAASITLGDKRLPGAAKSSLQISSSKELVGVEAAKDVFGDTDEEDGPAKKKGKSAPEPEPEETHAKAVAGKDYPAEWSDEEIVKGQKKAAAAEAKDTAAKKPKGW